MPRAERTRLARIERVLLLIRANPGGLAEAEIAEMLGLERRSVNNYLRDLEYQNQIYKDDRIWFPVRSNQMRLRHLDLSPEEAMTLYLAARLFVKQTDKRIESAESALYKLAEALAADIGLGEEIRQAAHELAHRPGDQGYSRIFGTVVQGYLYRRGVRLVYEPRSGRPFETTLYVYLMEPSAIGYSTYAIGHSSLPDAMRTYKVERIRKAEITAEEYNVPPDFPGLEILRSAWSIIYGEDLVEVVLRFHPAVVDRVLETRWHPTEKKEPDADQRGHLLWSAQVADTTDMLPWVRGWGADVEVLAPRELREAMMGEARALAQLYGWSDERPSDHNRFRTIFGENG